MSLMRATRLLHPASRLMQGRLQYERSRVHKPVRRRRRNDSVKHIGSAFGRKSGYTCQSTMPNANIALPELSTIIAVLSTLAVPVATLIGVALTQRNNRKTKQLELGHNRELKEKELKRLV
jgi:hypothetical protein